MPVRNYAVLNTNITTNTATVVDALNGRQGDSNREVFFWLQDGKVGMNLTGKTITLYEKDADGVVKTASTVNDQTGISSGHFSLLIPKEFYQATGAVEDAYIQIQDGETIISTIPVAFQVLENTMVVTQTQNKVFIDDVQAIIADFNQRIEATGNNLQSVENAVQALQVTISNLNTQFNSDLFARKANDNEFKGNNTFDQKIIAPAGMQGKADSAVQADSATNAATATTATNANHATTADTLTTTNSQTVQDLTVNGQLVVNPAQKVHLTSTTDAFGLNAVIRRINDRVYVVIFGTAQNTGAYTWVGTIPTGYLPVDTHYFTAESQSDRVIAMNIAPNGHINISSIGTSDGKAHGLFASFSYMTLDSAPNN